MTTIGRRLSKAEKALAATPEMVKAQTMRRVNELLDLARARRQLMREQGVTFAQAVAKCS